jgi:membrane-associated phospholipid phosphatase
MPNPPSGDSARFANVIMGVSAGNIGTDISMVSEDSKEMILRKPAQIRALFLTPYFKNNPIILLSLFSSLLITIAFYFFLRSWQLNLIVTAQSAMGPVTLGFFQIISDFKSIISIGLPVSMLLIGYFGKKDMLRNKSLFILISLLISGSVSYGIKNTVRDLRPYEIDNRIQKLSVAGGYGFPSGHVAEATTVVVASLILWPNLWAFLFSSLWVILVMASRVYLGVHDVYQVFGGVFIGTLCPVFIYRLFHLLKRIPLG